MKSMRWFAALAAGVVSCLSFAASPFVLPADWRSWQHVKSMVIPDTTHGLYGFHHVYVGPKGLKALKAGKGYPEGVQFAVPFFEVKNEGGMVQQGALRMVAWMKRSAAAKETGGWQFGAFGPDGSAMKLDVKTACFDCHAAKKDREFVFTEWVD